MFTYNAQANEVVRWVDSDGVTHFGSPQSAPAGLGETVELQPANAMDAPVVVQNKSRSADRAQFTFVERKHIKNPRGFRGFEKRPSRHSGRRLNH